jgi:hypothetical protein
MHYYAALNYQKGSMNELTETKNENSKLKNTLIHFFDFLFSNAIGVSGLFILAGFVLTNEVIYLKIASALSLTVVLLFFLLSITALYKFGIDEVIAEIEIKFLDLTMYSAFISGTLLFLIVELFRIGQ